jgi:hypothetical protein
MCVTTGTGDAKNRAFSGVTSTPAAIPPRRTAPATTGTMLRTIRETGTSQSALGEEVIADSVVLVGGKAGVRLRCGAGGTRSRASR